MEFKKCNGGAYAAARKHGWLDEVCSHMKLLCRRNYWTKERVRKEALKYEAKGRFIRASPGAYNAAKKHGWLDEVCSHMKPKRHTPAPS